MLLHIGASLGPGETTLERLLLTRLPEHGGFMLNGLLGTLIYSEDICRGVMVVGWSRKPADAS